MSKSRDARKVFLLAHRRRVFTEGEDGVLAFLVDPEFCGSWRTAAAQIPGHSACQYGVRWRNYRAPTLSLVPWTPEEDALVIRKVAECGTKWEAIAKEIPRRSDNAIKNRWYTVLKRELAKSSTQPEPVPKDVPGPSLTPQETSIFEDGFSFLDNELAEGSGFTEYEGTGNDLSQVLLEWF
jgi:myb proto-oncogene protein